MSTEPYVHTDRMQTTRVHPEHVAGRDALIVDLNLAPWGPTEFGLTFDQATGLADLLNRAVNTFRTTDSDGDSDV